MLNYPALKRVMFLFLMLVISTLCANLTHAEKLLIRADKKGFPATYMKAHRWAGMDIEIIKELFSRAGLDYDYVEMPFLRSLLQIKQGTIHLIPNLVKNEERSSYLHWMGPTRVTCIGLVVQEKNKTLAINSTDELIMQAKQVQQKIGYLSGASYSPYLDKRLQQDLEFNEVLHLLPDNVQHRQMLKLGRLLGYFYDAFEIQQRLKDAAFAEQYQGLALHDYRIEESCTGAYFGISRKLDVGIYQRLVRAFDAMKQDGTFDKIHIRWVGVKPDL